MHEFKQAMMEEFEMTNLELMHYFLGVELYQSHDGKFICHVKYAQDLLKGFIMDNCK
jgi:hypothetical protein